MDAKTESFNIVFDQLRAILTPYEQSLVVKSDQDGDYYLETRHLTKNKQPLFFGSVKTQKNYVSFYLMPVYACPNLIDNISLELKKHMQGKSCFNFKTADPVLFSELADLTKKGFERYKREDWLE